MNDDLASLSRHDKLRMAVLVVALIGVSLWFSSQFLQPAPPRRIVMASGAEFGIYHQFAQRYKQILLTNGIVVEERMTGGAADNLRLLRDPKSGVDVAFMQGGIATAFDAEDVEMLASLYYEPLWVFYRNPKPLTQLTQLRGKRIAVGAIGSGTRAFVEPLLAFNAVLRSNSTLLSAGGEAAIRALQAGDVDAVLLVGGVQTPIIMEALRDPAIKVMSFSRADAYTRRFPHINKLVLPSGTLDLAQDIPGQDVVLIGTKAMLAVRPGLHPALSLRPASRREGLHCARRTDRRCHHRACAQTTERGRRMRRSRVARRPRPGRRSQPKTGRRTRMRARPRSMGGASTAIRTM